MLGEEGAVPELVNAGSHVPLLNSDQILLFAWGADQATAFEREVIKRRGMSIVPVDEVARDPRAVPQPGPVS